MNIEKYTNLELINAIQRGGADRDQVLKYLFLKSSYAEIVRKIVIEAGGDNDHSDVVFEDCLVQFDRLVRRLEWSEQTSLDQFFEEESKRNWCNRLMVNDLVRGTVLNSISGDMKLQRQIFGAIVNQGGKIEDAQDCYQNGVMLLETQLREGKYKGGAIKGFFYQICFNVWRNELKRKRPERLDQEEMNFFVRSDSPQQVLESQERAELLEKIFSMLGESCQKILSLKFFVVDQLSMDEIAQQMGLKSAQNASNALSKCRKRLWELLNEQEYEHAYLWKKNI